MLKSLSLGILLLAGCSGNKNNHINDIQPQNLTNATVIKHSLFSDGNNECVMFELDSDNNLATWEHFVKIYNSEINNYKYMQDGAKITIRKTDNVWLNKSEIIGQKQR